MAARPEYADEHHQFRQLVCDFAQQTVVPAHEDWEKAGKLGLLGFSVPSTSASQGVNDFRYNAIVIEELQRVGAAFEAVAFSLQNDIVLPYLTRAAPRTHTG